MLLLRRDFFSFKVENEELEKKMVDMKNKIIEMEKIEDDFMDENKDFNDRLDSLSFEIEKL